MEYTFRTVTQDDRRELLYNQLRAAELDILYHGNNAEMAKVSGDENTAAEQADYQATALARAQAAAAALDAIPEQKAPADGDLSAPVSAPVTIDLPDPAPADQAEPVAGQAAPSAAVTAADAPTS